MGYIDFYQDLETRETEEAHALSGSIVIRWAWLIRTARTAHILSKYISSFRASPVVLDIGCAGMWLHKSLLSRKAHHRYVGCDISFPYLSRIGSTPYSSKVLCNASQLPFRNDSSELVTAFEVIEHLSDPSSCVSEIQRVSQHFILVSVPMEGTPLMKQDSVRYNKYAEQKDKKLREFLERAGWENGLRIIEMKTGSPHINVFTFTKLVRMFSGKHALSDSFGAFFYLPFLDKILRYRITRSIYLLLEKTLFSRLKLFVVYISILPKRFRPLGNRYGFVIMKRRVAHESE